MTVLTSPEDSSARLLGAIVLAPATDRRQLTPRELEVLGLVIAGRSNKQIAHALAVAQRTVAERQGLYVPPSDACDGTVSQSA